MAATKKPSPAQLAARKRFAEMAKSGAFKRKARAGRKRPVSKAASGKSRVTRAPSPAQLKARAEFAAAARARSKASKAGKKKNPIRLTEAEARRYSGKIKGLSTPTRTRATTKRRKKFKKVGVFGGSGFLGLGRSTKRISANPRGQHLPGLPAKYQHMYEDILASSGSKRIAAATTKKAFERGNPSLFAKLFGRKRKAAKVGYRKTQVGRRKVAPVGYRKTQRGKRRPTTYMQRMSAKRGRSRLLNPAPAEVFKEFRGKDVRSKSKSIGHGTGHITVAQLGQLRELKLVGKKLEFGGKALLCADGRKKLHIAGVRFKAPGQESDMGEVRSVTYRSDKPHIETGVLDYVHKFGEEGGKCPKLIIDTEGYPYFEGGSYTIDADGIIN